MGSTSSHAYKRSGLPVHNPSSSFWHSEPNEFLLGHRTTPEIPVEADIVIVGSGITGTSAARFLCEDPRAKGKSIVMLEAREACWGATGRNGGHCQVLPVARAPDVTHFEILNYNAVKAYIEEHNVPCEWRSLDGCHAYYSSGLFREEQAKVAALKEEDPELGEIVRVVTDKHDLAEHRVSKAVGCTLTSAAASLWPYKLVAFILEHLIKCGDLNLQTHTPVESLSATKDHAAAATHPHTLHTPRGTIRAREVILATNGYTSHLLPEFANIIVPVRGEMSALLPPPGAPRLPNSYGLAGQPDQPEHWGDYLNQRPYEGVPNPAGHYMYGGGYGAAKHERVGVWDDSIVDKGMAKWLRRRLPMFMDLGGETDGLKELGSVGSRGRQCGSLVDTLVSGFSVDIACLEWVVDSTCISTGHGMPNATLCGKAVVDMLLGVEAGASVADAQEQVVEKMGLPRGYLITEKRLAEAKELPPVAEAVKLGLLGNNAKKT